MNYTTNYHLPQWVESDRILMEDFNEAMSGIDGGIAEAKTTAETAESKADAAQSAAEAAQNSADALADAYTPNNQPYVVGSYTGTGEDMTITLGFRPKFVLISGMGSDTMLNESDEWTAYYGLCDGTVLSKRLAFTNTGFIARAKYGFYDAYPDFTASGRVYGYIAFR